MSEYEFSTDWFTTHKILWNAVIQYLKPKRVLEIGSFEGRSACYLIAALNGIPGAEITCVDPWEQYWEMDRIMSEVETKFDKNTSLALQISSVKLRKIKGNSHRVMAKMLAEGEPLFDLIYIDGSHLAADVFLDAALAYRLLRPGGVIIFDDSEYTKGENSGERFKHPKPAIDAFMYVYADSMAPMPFEIDVNGEKKSLYAVLEEKNIGPLYQKYLLKKPE